MLKKAETGGRGRTKSTYEDDFPCLVDMGIDTKDFDELLLRVYGYAGEETEDASDEECEEGFDVNGL